MSQPISANVGKLLLLFRQAIEAEREAQVLYDDMLASCEDPSLRKILEEFVRTEKGHEESLLLQYRRLRQTEDFKD
jgi:rubrerythrin